MSNILNMLLRYTFCIISIIILLILGLMFFYFNNQIVYQNAKINSMIDVVSELVQKKTDDNVISHPYTPGSSTNSFLPQMNIIDVSDSDIEDDDDDDDEDEDEDDDDDDEGEDENLQAFNNLEKELDGLVIDYNDDVVESIEPDFDSNKEVSEDTNVTIEVSLDAQLAEPKQQQISYKSLQVNEIREIVIQKNLLSSVEAKKMKKNELIDLLNKNDGEEASE